MAALPLAAQPAWQRIAPWQPLQDGTGLPAGWPVLGLQLSPGRVAVRLHQVRLPGLGLAQVVFNCAVRLQSRPRDAGQPGRPSAPAPLCLAMALDLQGPARFSAQALGPDTILIGREDALDLCLPAGAGLIAVAVDATLLAQAWQQLYRKPLSPWINLQLVVQASPAQAQALRQQHLAVLAQLAAQPALLHDTAALLKLRDALLLEWLEAIPPRVDVDALLAAQARQRVVDRACALVLARPDLPLSMAQVSHQIGSSPRKLAYCFDSVLGISPARYLRAARLNGARRDLCRQPGVSVQDVAARWGFGHDGDFAAAYRRLFGERPSDTLRQAGAGRSLTDKPNTTLVTTTVNPATPPAPPRARHPAPCPSAHDPDPPARPDPGPAAGRLCQRAATTAPTGGPR